MDEHQSGEGQKGETWRIEGVCGYRMSFSALCGSDDDMHTESELLMWAGVGSEVSHHDW